MVGVPSVRQMSCMELAWASSARVATQYALARGLLLAILPLERYLVDDPGVGVDDSWAASRYVYEFWCSGHLQERLYRLRAPVIGLDWNMGAARGLSTSGRLVCSRSPGRFRQVSTPPYLWLFICLSCSVAGRTRWSSLWSWGGIYGWVDLQHLDAACLHSSRASQLSTWMPQQCWLALWLPRVST